MVPQYVFFIYIHPQPARSSHLISSTRFSRKSLKSIADAGGNNLDQYGLTQCCSRDTSSYVDEMLRL